MTTKHTDNLLNEAQRLHEWLQENALDVTETQAKQVQSIINAVWPILERRKSNDRRAKSWF